MLHHRRVHPELDIDFGVLYDAINTLSPPDLTQKDSTRRPGGPWWLRCFSANDTADTGLNSFMRPVMEQLHKLMTAVSPELTVALMELSLFHPDDPKGTRFFSFILGPEASLVSYLELIQKNVSETGSSIPIIPNGFLYESPFYTKYHEQHYPSIRLEEDFSKLVDETALVLVEYVVPANYVDTEDTFEPLCAQIERTFDSVMKDILTKPKNGMDRGSMNADFSALIPLLRPAAFHDTSVPTSHERVRGGGLFIYGQFNHLTQANETSRTRSVEPASFLLRPRHALLRGIMEISYSKVDHDRWELLTAQAATLANAHEIRKFVAPISIGSPPSMLKIVRAYFEFMFPIQFDEPFYSLSGMPFITTTCPVESSESKDLDTWVKAAYDVAAVLAAALYAIPETRIEDEFSRLMNGRLPYYTKRLQAEDTLSESQIELDVNTGRAFFGALVCALRNTLEHCDYSEPIQVSKLVTENRSYIKIRNRRAEKDVVVGEKDKTKRLASTGDALSNYVSFYEQGSGHKSGPFLGIDESNENYYVTQLPIPSGGKGNK